MSVTSNLYAVLSLDTSAGTNQPTTVDTVNSTVTIGNYAAGPVTVAVTSTPASIPLASAPTLAVYNLEVIHRGISTDPNIVLDMRDGTASPVSNKITIAPGGRVYLFNCSVTATGTTTGTSKFTNWQLSTASGTTSCSVSIVYS